MGFDGVAQAMSGVMYMSGHEEEPMRSYYPWVDFTTAILTAFGTMAAILERKKTGRGQQVEGSLLMSALTVGNTALIEQDVIEANRVATGNRAQTAAPSDCFHTKDGWVLMMVVGQPLFERWADLMGEQHWLEDPRFEDDLSRDDNSGAITERMARWCRVARRSSVWPSSTPHGFLPVPYCPRRRPSITSTSAPCGSCSQSNTSASASRRR